MSSFKIKFINRNKILPQNKYVDLFLIELIRNKTTEYKNYMIIPKLILDTYRLFVNFKLVFFILALVLCSEATQAQRIVRVGAFNYYPAIFRDDAGEIKGFYVDALDDIAEKENIKFVYVYGSWNEGLERIQNGEIDLITSAAYTSERAKFLDFSETPLMTVWGEVYVKPSSDIQGIKDLEGKTIATMKGDINSTNLIELNEKLSINCNYIEAYDSDHVFELIASGEVDAGVVNSTFGTPKHREYGLRSSGIVFNPFDIHFAVAKNQNTSLIIHLSRYLDNALADANSVYNQARIKWSHGKASPIEVFPQWAIYSLYAALIFILILILFITLLRFQVKKVTLKVRNSESRFKAFMDNTPAHIYIKDKNLNHIFRNRNLNSMDNIYLSNKPTSAKTIFEPEIAEMVERTDQMILNGDQKQANLQYYCKLNNHYIWLNDFKFALNLPNEEPKVGGISFDITKQKETEQAIIKAKEEAEQSNRLKTAFLHNLSHEIRTPINAISGFSTILTKPNLSEAKRKHFTNIIHNSSQQLLSIVNNILTISSLETNQEAVKNETLNLNQLINEQVAIFSTKANHLGINFYTKFASPDKHSEIYTDKTKLNQILSNLLSNAFKFTSSGSIECGYRYKDQQLEFYVKDTGIGIAPEFQNQVFDRFIQADDTIHVDYGGAGLGLSISKSFVNLLGGEIWLESELGKGSTFFFTIPQLSQNNSTDEDPIIEPKRKSKTSDRQKTIMIAEDQEFNFNFFEELLMDFNIKLIHAKNGREAVEHCKSNADIDMVLMDIKMPIMNGYDATKLIRELRPDLPIIAQSAFALEHEIKKYSDTFDDYITKPIDEDILREKLQRFLKIDDQS